MLIYVTTGNKPHRPITLYTDIHLVTLLPNPFVSDSSGVSFAIAKAGSYRICFEKLGLPKGTPIPCFALNIAGPAMYGTLLPKTEKKP